MDTLVKIVVEYRFQYGIVPYMKGGKNIMATNDNNTVDSTVVYLVVESSKRYKSRPYISIFESKSFTNYNSAKLLAEALNNSRESDDDKKNCYSVSSVAIPNRVYEMTE